MIEQNKLIALVTKAQQGDNAAFDDLFNQSYNEIYYFVLKTVKDADLASDITQDTFLAAFKNIKGLKEPAAYVSWIRRIAYRQCAQHFQKKQDVLVEEDEDGNTIFDTVAEDGADFIPHEALDQEEFRKTIMQMIESLSEDQRSAVLMYYYEELSVAQIAEIQGVSEGTVKSRLNYARKAIKTSVEDYEDKHKIKLHAIPFFPFISWLFKKDFSATKLFTSAEIAAKSTAVTGSVSAAGQAAGVAAKGVAKVVAKSATGSAVKAAAPATAKLTAALIAGAIFTGVATAGIAIGVQSAISYDNKNPYDDEHITSGYVSGSDYDNDYNDDYGNGYIDDGDYDSDKLTADGETVTENLFCALFTFDMSRGDKILDVYYADPFGSDPSIPFGAGVYYMRGEDFEEMAARVYNINSQTLREMRNHSTFKFTQGSIKLPDGSRLPAGNSGYYFFEYSSPDDLPVMNSNNPFLKYLAEEYI